jgi:methionyl-tRNA formyltransferase
VRLAFAGSPAPAVPSLRALLDSRHEVVAVITRPPSRAGRGRQARTTPVAELARAAGLPVLTPQRPGEPGFLETLRELSVDCCAVVAYGALLPPAALEIPPRGWVNLHFSLLPAWRGAAPVQHAILHGDELTGATTFRIEAGLDTGPVYGVVTEPIHPSDTAGELLERLAGSGAQLLVATMDGIESGTLEPRPQPPEGVSIASKITVADAAVPWSAPGVHVDRLVRACTPSPGAWTTFRGERVKLGPVVAYPAGGVPPGAPEEDLAPGELAAASAVRVGTGTRPVMLGTVQPPGRRAMPAADWARGARVRPGERFG